MWKQKGFRWYLYVTQDTLDKICTILECQPGFLLEYEPDEKNKMFEENLLTYIKK
ncbi:hypothetical protein B5F53_03465 [Blautia sp. An249]|nr:hypothetical protein B5F53_03465 [Blautia sp. An249]